MWKWGTNEGASFPHSSLIPTKMPHLARMFDTTKTTRTEIVFFFVALCCHVNDLIWQHEWIQNVLMLILFFLSPKWVSQNYARKLYHKSPFWSWFVVVRVFIFKTNFRTHEGLSFSLDLFFLFFQGSGTRRFHLHDLQPEIMTVAEKLYAQKLIYHKNENPFDIDSILTRTI